MTVEIIDIAPFSAFDNGAKSNLVHRWKTALEGLGFVIITGHGIPEELGERLYRLAWAFFDRPVGEKLQCCGGKSGGVPQGYVPFLTENVGRTRGLDAAADLCESFMLHNLLHHRDPESALRGLWPQNPTGFAQAVIDYVLAVHDLARRLMRISALALDLPERYFDAAYSRMSHTLRLVAYPDLEADPLPGQMRNGPHTDFGGFTILRQDGGPGGLQVQDGNGDWCDVGAYPGSLTINTGDLIQRWTNDRWRSNLHRVVVPERSTVGPERRLSIVFFTAPNDDAEIACLPSCATAEVPPKYPPIRTWNHMAEKVAKTYAGSVEAAAPGGRTTR